VTTVLRSLRPLTESRRDPAERKLAVRRQCVGCEPRELRDVVRRLRLTVDESGLEHEVERGRRVVARPVVIAEGTDEVADLDLEPGLLAHLAVHRVDEPLVLLQEASDRVPLARVWLVCPPPEQEAAVAVEDEGRDRGHRVRVADEAALRALDAGIEMGQLGGAARAEMPASEDRHAGTVLPVSPRHVPASVTELARVGLFADLTGETLTKLADRMQREDVTSGTVMIREGEPGDRFFVLLSGVAAVSQATLGERRILKAGEFFGEVALAMNVARTATVTAMTPCVVASCDEATFDELVRPLFADD